MQFKLSNKLRCVGETDLRKHHWHRWLFRWCVPPFCPVLVVPANALDWQLKESRCSITFSIEPTFFSTCEWLSGSLQLDFNVVLMFDNDYTVLHGILFESQTIESTIELVCVHMIVFLGAWFINCIGSNLRGWHCLQGDASNLFRYGIIILRYCTIFR